MGPYAHHAATNVSVFLYQGDSVFLWSLKLLDRALYI